MEMNQKICRARLSHGRVPNLVARLDGFISLLHVRDTSTSSVSIHTWHAAGRLRAAAGSLHNTGFIPYSATERIQTPPPCYRIQGRKRLGVFPLEHRLNDFPATMWCNSDSSCMTESSENLAGPQQLLDHENEAPAGFAKSGICKSQRTWRGKGCEHIHV